jgi:hypothetical protein
MDSQPVGNYLSRPSLVRGISARSNYSSHASLRQVLAEQPHDTLLSVFLDARSTQGSARTRLCVSRADLQRGDYRFDLSTRRDRDPVFQHTGPSGVPRQNEEGYGATDDNFDPLSVRQPPYLRVASARFTPPMFLRFLTALTRPRNG